MKRETRDEAIARADRASTKETLMLMVLNDVCNPAAVYWETHGRYTFGSSRLTGAVGGLFTTKFRQDSGRIQVDVQLLDEAIAWAHAYGCSTDEDLMNRKTAIYHAEELRNKAFAGAH